MVFANSCSVMDLTEQKQESTEQCNSNRKSLKSASLLGDRFAANMRNSKQRRLQPKNRFTYQTGLCDPSPWAIRRHSSSSHWVLNVKLEACLIENKIM